jgi:hypothetical protein
MRPRRRRVRGWVVGIVVVLLLLVCFDCVCFGPFWICEDWVEDEQALCGCVFQVSKSWLYGKAVLIIMVFKILISYCQRDGFLLSGFRT